MNSWFYPTGYSRRRSRTRLIVAVIFALLILFTLILVKSTAANKITSHHVTNVPVSKLENKTLTASFSNFTCSDYQAVFGPNYNNQLFLNWATWTSIDSANSGLFNQGSGAYKSKSESLCKLPV